MPLFLILLVLIAIIVIPCVKIVPQSKSYVIERLGSYYTTWEHGVHFMVPFMDRIVNIVLLKEITIYFLLFIISFSRISDIQKIKITETKYPRFAVEFIKINNIKGNLFVDFTWASYCAYKLYPNNLIAMDGRYEEVYNPDLLYDLKKFHLVQNDWSKIIRDYKTDVIIIEKQYPIYNKLLTMDEWQQVFDNNIFAVFVPVNNLKEEYLYPVPYDDYYNNTLFQTDISYMKL